MDRYLRPLSAVGDVADEGVLELERPSAEFYAVANIAETREFSVALLPRLFTLRARPKRHDLLPMTRPIEGSTRTYERTFTVEDVRQFADLSGDAQPRHLESDEDGRLMVQGLLTATMPTKLGGEAEVLARSMRFEFLRPVYTGEPITCSSTYEAVEERDDRYEFTSDVVCENEEGEAVLMGSIEGLIWKDG